MNREEQIRTDSVCLWFEATDDPLEPGTAGLEPFLGALETYAGEWMPQFAKGKRRRKYSRAAVRTCLNESWDSLFGCDVWFRREFPDLEMAAQIRTPPTRNQFWVHADIRPLSLMDDPTRAENWSRRFIELFRAWASRYSVTYAYVHAGSDAALSEHWVGQSQQIDPAQAPREWLSAIFWLNVFSKGWVDALGRARVLSTPAHLVEELPNGAVLLVTRPTVADWSSEEARQAQARAFVHLRPDFDFDTVLRALRERSATLAPVAPAFDPDSAPFFQRVMDRFSPVERPQKTAELNALQLPEVDEWLPANAAPRSDVSDPEAVIEHYRDLADQLTVMLHPDVQTIFSSTPEALAGIDYRLWWEEFPEFYEREKVEQRALPAIGAYLGEMLVHHLGGRWIPRQNMDESQVVIGDRAWLPFARARRCLRSTQSILEYSLTRFYSTAKRHRDSLPTGG